ncbi:MAG TPA: LLM class flavin-dependent oxidoreductase, partial [Candidatus Angelobacter sp.]|nr:LLM class flavin-dependent oxidoreductase [Candidatus Angelobacter sp.]
RAVENFGYSRYWIAEHHNSIGYACASPEILIGYIAASTSRLKVGAGGVMISNYSPLKVAETFKTLTSLFPGRIDLGIGRASGADPIATRALQGTAGVRNDHIERIQLLLGFLHDGLDEAHEYALVEAVPSAAEVPDLCLLGSTLETAKAAARLGLPFCFARFFNSTGAAEAFELYRGSFQPSKYLDSPKCSIAVSALCADSQAEAAKLASSAELWQVRAMKGLQTKVPDATEAMAYAYDAEEQEQLARIRSRTITGDTGSVASTLQALARSLQVDEIFVLTVCHNQQARVRSYSRLANFLLNGRL